jgi:hypothetical protein
MRFAAALFLSLAAVVAPAMAQEAPLVSPILTGEEAKDPWTFAEPEVARVTHVALDLTLDFAGKTVAGTAALDIQAAPGADTVVLDSQGLAVGRVTDVLGNPLEFTVGEAVEGKGSPLTIVFRNARKIIVHYTAAEGAEALQWLAPEQTAGGKHPVPAQPGPADAQPQLDPDAGQPGHPPDLGSADRRAQAADGGDVGPQDRRARGPRRQRAPSASRWTSRSRRT